jgi:quercetin dioxygenase-like cupin family protein
MREIMNFKYLGKANNIEKLKLISSQFTNEHWQKFKKRKDDVAGKVSDTIPLIFDWKNKSDYIVHENYDYFSNELKEIENLLIDNGYKGEILRANLVRLPAGNVIPLHKDVGEFLNKTHRIHICIFSNENCTFTVGDETIAFKSGDVWEINNTGKYHGVKNLGNTDRVNLIIDAL